MTATYKVGIMGPRAPSRTQRRRRPPTAPDVLRGKLPKLDELFAELAAASVELGAANAELQTAERAQHNAAAADARAYADARRTGAKDPGGTHADEAARLLADAQRRQAGGRLLIARVNRDIEALLDRQGGELVAELLGERSASLAVKREAEIAVEAAAAEVKRVETVIQWLQSGPGEDGQ